MSLQQTIDQYQSLTVGELQGAEIATGFMNQDVATLRIEYEVQRLRTIQSSGLNCPTNLPRKGAIVYFHRLEDDNARRDCRIGRALIAGEITEGSTIHVGVEGGELATSIETPKPVAVAD